MSVQIYKPQGTRPPRGRSVLRGLLGVVVLFLTALDALVTAVLGWAPLTPKLREIRQVIADEYRAASHGAVDADVIGEDE